VSGELYRYVLSDVFVESPTIRITLEFSWSWRIRRMRVTYVAVSYESLMLLDCSGHL
jgi:hypothetical protein